MTIASSGFEKANALRKNAKKATSSTGFFLEKSSSLSNVSSIQSQFGPSRLVTLKRTNPPDSGTYRRISFRIGGGILPPNWKSYPQPFPNSPRPPAGPIEEELAARRHPLDAHN